MSMREETIEEMYSLFRKARGPLPVAILIDEKTDKKNHA